MADRFPEQSETEFTPLVDQKNGENTKKAIKSFYCKCINEIMLRMTPIYFCHYSTRVRQRTLSAFRKQRKNKTNTLSGRMLKELLNSVIAKLFASQLFASAYGFGK